MSSSNLVSITYWKETLGYGVKPTTLSAVTLKTARVVTDSLSGSPVTEESDEARPDRNSNGLTAVGLDVGGDLNWTLSEDLFFDDFFEAAMLSTWVVDETVATTVTLTPDGGDDQLATLTLADEFANLVPGVLVKLEAPGGDVIVSVISVTTPSTVFQVATTKGEAAISAVAMDATLPQYVDVGTTKTSFLIAKAYQDVISSGTDYRGQIYLGELISGFSLDAAYGDKVSGAFTTVGNGTEQEDKSFEQQVPDAGGSVTAAGTGRKMSASIDMPLVTSDGVATDYCIESITVTLDNGLRPQNCIGKDAPTDYNLGEAAISVSASIYNSETSYSEFMPNKLTLDPIAITFAVHNGTSGYAFHMPAVQLAFRDPEKGEKNTDTMLEMEGQAKYGTADIVSALRIYKL